MSWYSTMLDFIFLFAQVMSHNEVHLWAWFKAAFHLRRSMSSMAIYWRGKSKGYLRQTFKMPCFDVTHESSQGYLYVLSVSWTATDLHSKFSLTLTLSPTKSNKGKWKKCAKSHYVIEAGITWARNCCPGSATQVTCRGWTVHCGARDPRGEPSFFDPSLLEEIV